MHKTTLTLLLLSALSLQACSKTEHATTAAASQAQTEATPPSGIPLSEVGKMAIESNGKAALQQLLDQKLQTPIPSLQSITSSSSIKIRITKAYITIRGIFALKRMPLRTPLVVIIPTFSGIPTRMKSVQV
jgi:hypothetical protein